MATANNQVPVFGAVTLQSWFGPGTNAAIQTQAQRQATAPPALPPVSLGDGDMPPHPIDPVLPPGGFGGVGPGGVPIQTPGDGGGGVAITPPSNPLPLPPIYLPVESPPQVTPTPIPMVTQPHTHVFVMLLVVVAIVWWVWLK